MKPINEMTPAEARAALAALPPVAEEVMEAVIQFHLSNAEEQNALDACIRQRAALTARGAEDA